MSKYIFYVCIGITFLSGAFLYGVLAHRGDLPPVPQLKTAYRILFLNDGFAGHPRSEHLQPSRGQGNGVVLNSIPDDGSLVAMVGFFDEETQMRLVQRDGTLVKKWSLNYLEHFPNKDAHICRVNTPLDVDVHGAYVTPHGEVVFNYEYCGTVKLDQCGEVLWTINEPTHHSVVPAAAGGYWLLGRWEWWTSEFPDRFPPFSATNASRRLMEDTIMRVDVDGQILDEISIPEIMRASGLEAILTADGENFQRSTLPRRELVHSNKLSELSAALADAYPLFDAGDLAISMRQLNLVMVLDGETKEVKWHQVGPWLRQHDPEFRTDGRISIFNNNVYRLAYFNDKTDLDHPFKTNIIVVDPVTRETEVVFGERPGQEMLSVIRGQHELLADDSMLIIEFDAGRVLQVDAAGEITWEYVNRYDDDNVGEITNAAVLPADYFATDLRNCPG